MRGPETDSVLILGFCGAKNQRKRGRRDDVRNPAVKGSNIEQMAGSRVQRLNADITLDRLVEALMEPVGRQARWQVAEATRKADR
jgi:hypothetical protein